MGREMATESLPVGATSPHDLLLRAAVLSVFDVDWIYGRLVDAEVDDVVNFLSSSCERVVDSTGTPRWQLRDDERIRVLRRIPRASLRAVMDSVAIRPDDPVQAALEQYLNESLPPVDQLDEAGLSGVLKLERWVGEDAGLPAASDIQARLDWITLVGPLQRLVARGFFGRQDLLIELRSFVTSESSQPGTFLIEGVGGSGKSTALAQFILYQPALFDLAVYISFDRGWLIDGGPWTIFDEIVRQIGAQDADRRPKADGLRMQAQRLAGRSSGYSDSASRGSQQRDPIGPDLLQNLAELVSGRERLVVVFDTLEELRRRDESLAYDIFGFLTELSRSVTQVRVIAAGRSLPDAALASGRRWPMTGLNDSDALQLLRALTVGTHIGDELLQETVQLAQGNPLSLHLGADVLKRTGEGPTQLIAVAEGNVQGQLYSRLLEHIRDPQVRAVAHPGLVVRRLTPAIIREVLAEPCGIAPLNESEAARIFRALRDEATLCEPSPDGDGALVHRQDVRALMLPSIQQDRPGTTRTIHEAAVRYYEAEPDSLAPRRGPSLVARREELYHRLMLKQDRPTLDQRWDPATAADLATVIDEFPPRSQLYLTTKRRGLRLDPATRAEADDDEWQDAVRPAAMLRIERGQVAEALELVQERRGSDGRPLLPDLEIEALERLDRVQEALSLARKERQRASQKGGLGEVRALISQEARILERMRQWPAAWELMACLAALDRNRRARTDKLDDEVRIRELVVLTSMLRIARNEMSLRERMRHVTSSTVRIVRGQRRPDRHIDELTRETASLAEATPQRLLTANPSLLRDLAVEIGSNAPQILQLAASALAAPADADLGAAHPETAGTTYSIAKAAEKLRPEPVVNASDTERKLLAQFRSVSDNAQGYLWGGLVISYLTLRQAVGWIAILLPFVLSTGNLISSTVSPPQSLSGYYYTDMRNIFVGAFCALGVLLVAYSGYDYVDRWITNIAGLGAIGLAFCPTKPAVCVTGVVACPVPSVRNLSASQQVVGDIHLVFAFLAIIMMGLMALRFAKTGPTPSGQGLVGQLRYGLGFGPPVPGQPRASAVDTVIYRVSGTTIFSCVLLAILANLLPASVNASWRLLFIFEAVAVIAFGVSWFVKGRAISGFVSQIRPPATIPVMAVQELDDQP
jgi:hypothetical protein